jgi:hypothetical protein
VLRRRLNLGLTRTLEPALLHVAAEHPGKAGVAVALAIGGTHERLLHDRLRRAFVNELLQSPS